MTTIKQLLDRIKWDESMDPEKFRIYYLDRKDNKLKEIRYVDIKKFEGTYMIIEKNGEDTAIPMHRIKRVTKAGFTFWKRD
jgi:uncharacterized protein (UPF0248 family)